MSEEELFALMPPSWVAVIKAAKESRRTKLSDNFSHADYERFEAADEDLHIAAYAIKDIDPLEQRSIDTVLNADVLAGIRPATAKKEGALLVGVDLGHLDNAAVYAITGPEGQELQVLDGNSHHIAAQVSRPSRACSSCVNQSDRPHEGPCRECMMDLKNNYKTFKLGEHGITAIGPEFAADPTLKTQRTLYLEGCAKTLRAHNNDPWLAALLPPSAVYCYCGQKKAEPEKCECSPKRAMKTLPPPPVDPAKDAIPAGVQPMYEHCTHMWILSVGTEERVCELCGKTSRQAGVFTDSDDTSGGLPWRPRADSTDQKSLRVEWQVKFLDFDDRPHCPDHPLAYIESRRISGKDNSRHWVCTECSKSLGYAPEEKKDNG